MTQRLRMGVVGAGHFGTFHARKIAALDTVDLVGIADIRLEQAEKLTAELGGRACDDAAGLLGQVDAVTIAVPAAAHFDVASVFMKAGVHVLVEKPLTDDLATARALAALAESTGVVLQVGQLERFSSVFEVVRGRITRPLYVESVRISPFKARGTDVNVVLDVMIHDIDAIVALVDQPIIDIDAVGAPVFSETEDIANARVKFAGGCVANITASRVSLKTERKLRIFQPDQYIGVDYDKRNVRIVSKGTGGGSSIMPDVNIEQENYEETDALEREIGAFVAAVTGEGPRLVTGEDGVRSLEVAMRIGDSMAENRERMGATPPEAI